MYALLKHPKRFIWDFWYFYDKKTSIFHVLYLNTDPTLVNNNQHHFSSVVGYAVTKDFIQMEWIDFDVFHAEPDGWDDTSIWTGDIIQCRNGFLFYYTSRNSCVDDCMTQNIGLAFSTNFRDWRRVENFRLAPNTQYYEPRSVKGDDTIHSWRDPYLFINEGNIYMLVAAKDIKQPPTRKGSIALLRSIKNSLTNWEVLPPLYSPGCVSECDVPIIYKYYDKLILIYSCWAKFDHASAKESKGGLHVVKGKGMDLTPENFLSNPSTLLPERTGYYACRVVPELGGELVGPDFKQGGIRRIAIRTGFQNLNRDFSFFTFE